MPAASMPTMLGVNSTSGQRKRSLPIVITCAHASARLAVTPLSPPLLVLAAGAAAAAPTQALRWRRAKWGACGGRAWPSGSSYDFSMVDEDAEVASSCS